MSRETILTNDDTFGEGSFEKRTPPDTEFRCEVASEDGIYCPHCGTRQGFHTARGNRVNRCDFCTLHFYTEIQITTTYVSSTLSRATPPPSNN